MKLFSTPLWLLLLQSFSAVSGAVVCDRLCLENLLSDYLTALTEHDPSKLNTTSDVLYTENSQVVPIGTGEWLVAGSPGKYRHTFSDPEARQVGTITTITENGVRFIYIARLGLNENGQIHEIETHITRDSGGAALYENMTAPEPVWLQPVPVEKRISREQLVAQSNKYYSGMERNDPKGDYSFFDKECNRLEDGLQTTNMDNGDPYGHSNDTVFASLGCEEQFQTGFLGFVTKIRARRYPVVDEERQAVLAFTILDHNGTVRELPDINGTSSPIPPYFDVPRSLLAAEAFRLRADKLYRIEMTLTEVPYGMRSPFQEDPPPYVPIPDFGTITDPCDRVCLDGVLNQVIQAMTGNAASSLPLAKDARYSENGQFIGFNDGLWETLDSAAYPGPDEYAARFADPETGNAAYWGLSQEETTPGVLALRIKVESGQITEVEAIGVRAESVGQRGGTLTLMRPALPVEWNGSGLKQLDASFQEKATEDSAVPDAVIKAYFDGLERHSSHGVPFASTCLRRDNSAQSNVSCAAQIEGQGRAPNGLHNLTTTVRDRRVLVSDTEQGVVLAVALVDSPATASLLPTQRIPSTYMVPQLIKVVNGSITRVEGMVKWVPYGYESEWSSVPPT